VCALTLGNACHYSSFVSFLITGKRHVLDGAGIFRATSNLWHQLEVLLGSCRLHGGQRKAAFARLPIFGTYAPPSKLNGAWI